jgi:hypothetical protein
MAVTTVTTKMASAINYTVVTDNSSDWPSVANSTYFYDKTDKLVHYKNSTGTVIELFSSDGVTILNNVDNRLITATGNNGELNAEPLLTFDGTVLSLMYQSGIEGGEIFLNKAETGTTLTNGVTIDVYENRLRIFEAGGSNRGGYFDLTTLGNSVSTNLVPTLYLLEAYANVTYTLPGSFTEDICRYSIVNNTVNVSSSWFNTSTYRFTPQKAGYWEITASYDVYRNSEASMAIKKNNSIVAAAGSFDAVAQQITKIIYLNGSTDFINIYNVGGAALERAQFESRSWFQARWVGE